MHINNLVKPHKTFSLFFGSLIGANHYNGNTTPSGSPVPQSAAQPPEEKPMNQRVRTGALLAGGYGCYQAVS